MDRVRCRIVAKDIKRGTSARALGLSSPTPSIEGPGGVIDKVIAARTIEQTVKQLWIRVVARLISDHMSPEQVPIRTKR